MNLIIINGLPATGKTTIAKSLSKQLKVSAIAKDTIKEFLFDTLGIKDREWSRTLGMVSSDFLYVLADALLADKQSIILESAFEKRFAQPQLETLIHKHNPAVIEIYCTTEQSIRRKRFVERNQTGRRHIGHVDHENYLDDNDVEPIEKFAPLELSIGECIKIDTTSFRDKDVKKVIAVVEEALNSPQIRSS